MTWKLIKYSDNFTSILMKFLLSYLPFCFSFLDMNNNKKHQKKNWGHVGILCDVMLKNLQHVQDRQCMYNVTVRPACVTIVAIEKQRVLHILGVYF